MSRTVRVTTRRATLPPQASPTSGPTELRPRDGFSPTRPHSLAGMRIDPPPSPAWPTGTMPEATAAADPPLEPPVESAGVPRVAGRAVERGLGGGLQPQLGRVGAADEHEPGLAEPGREVAVGRRDVAQVAAGGACHRGTAPRPGSRRGPSAPWARPGTGRRAARPPPRPGPARSAGGSPRSARGSAPRWPRSRPRPARAGTPRPSAPARPGRWRPAWTDPRS